MNKYLLHTPDGVRDIYGNECSDRNLLIEKIHNKMKNFGYQDIDTPTFEFFDVFAEEINTSDAKELYKFIDKEGNTLVLRPDFTPSIARCASKVMLEKDETVRVCYQGNVFMNTSSLQGKLRENYNIGVEMMNENSIYADAEMIALLVECLKAIGLTEFQISVGDADYYKGLCDEAGIDDETEAEIREQITSKNYFAAENIMTKREIPSKYIEQILKVSEFIGSDEALDKAENLACNERSLRAVKRLKELYKVLTCYGVQKYISFDLGVLSKFNYYTGVIFSAYTYGASDVIAKGGRYDNLLGKFGKDAPAIGFVIEIDNLISACKRQGIALDHEDKPRIVYYDDSNFEEALNEVKALREKDMSVCLMAKRTEG